jgi:hypothetical protein
MYINLKIKQIVPNVFAVIVPNNKHRAMLFLRVQEYYESPNPKFKRNTFDVEEYLKWYSKSKYSSKKSVDSYIRDWNGFNIPYDIAKECYMNLKDYPELMTPYDLYFYDILNYIHENKPRGKAYIIGTDNLSSKTTMHELHHALYYMDNEYRTNVHKFFKKIPRKTLMELKRILMDVGYEENVLYDELMTYLLVH